MASSCVGRAVPLLLLLGLLGLLAAAEEQAGGQGSPPVTLGTVVTGTAQQLQGYVESAVGTAVVRSVLEFLETVIRFLAEGAASGLNVIAVYVTEILRVTGFHAALPVVTPEAVTAVAQWGLLTLLGYWLLTVVLRLLVGVVRRLFWVLKTVAALWFFGLIVLDKAASADTTAARLAGLVLVCALLGLLAPGSEGGGGAVERRINSLEGRLKAVEKSKGD